MELCYWWCMTQDMAGDLWSFMCKICARPDSRLVQKMAALVVRVQYKKMSLDCFVILFASTLLLTEWPN